MAHRRRPVAGLSLACVCRRRAALRFPDRWNGGLLRRHEWSPGDDSGQPILLRHGITTPTGLAFDASGNLYVADYGTGANGTTVTKIAPGGGTGAVWGTGLSGPNGLAFDASGVLYVSNAGNGSAGNGSLSTVGVNGGAASSWVTGLNAPYGLAFDSSGSLYVANGSTISKFSSNGTLLFSFSTGTASPRFLAFDEVQPVPEPSAALSAGIAGVTALAAALRRRTAAS